MDVRELLGPDVSEGPRLPWREEMVTVTLGAWMLVGGFIDGWAHLNVHRTDSALSPWHAAPAADNPADEAPGSGVGGLLSLHRGTRFGLFDFLFSLLAGRF